MLKQKNTVFIGLFVLSRLQASATTTRLIQCSFLTQNQYQNQDKDDFVLKSSLGQARENNNKKISVTCFVGICNVHAMFVGTSNVISQINIPGGYSAVLSIVWHRLGLLNGLAIFCHVFRGSQGHTQVNQNIKLTQNSI